MRRVALAVVAVLGVLGVAAPTLAGAATPSAVVAPPPSPAAVLAVPATTSPIEASIVAALTAPLLASPALGGRASMSVVDLTAGTPVWESFGGRPQPPASVTKLLTAVSVLHAWGPATRLRTRTALAGDRLYLIGGGDVSLARHPIVLGGGEGQQLVPATITALAAQSAKALKGKGIRRVRLAYDASYFSGPSLAPGWSPSFVPSGVVSVVSALSVDGGRTAIDSDIRDAQPARVAADAFRSALTAAGLIVDGPPSPARAPESAVAVADVSSPRLQDLVEWLLTTSDNDYAEALWRVAGRKSGDGSFAAGSNAAVDAMRAIGVKDTAGLVLRDGSGLSGQDRVTAQTLTAVLAAAARDPEARVWPLWSGLPVAGATGTLAKRYTGAASPGRGVVRAKTGTLTGVSNLAGVVLTRTGHVLACAVLADRVVDKKSAQAQLDRIAAALSTL